MEIVKCTSNGTVSIPAGFRKRFNNQYYQVFEEADRIIFLPILLPVTPPKMDLKKKRWTINDLEKLIYNGRENLDTKKMTNDEVIAYAYEKKMKPYK